MGDRRRLALITGSVLIASVVARHAPVLAQPAGGGSGSDIEMEGDVPPAAGSGSAAEPAGPVKDPKIAKKWLTAAQQLVARGDQLVKAGKADEAKAQYENAITAYAKAMVAGDDPAVGLALAAAEDKAGHPGDAYKRLKELGTAQGGAKPDVQKKAQARLDELASKVGMVTLTIQPAGATISIAGKEVGEAPLAEPLVLAPGKYTLSFAAAGYQPKTADIRVEAGSESERKIELEPVKVVIKPHEVEPEPTTEVGPTKPNMLPLYISGGAAAGLVVIATITGIAAISNHGTFTDPKTLPLDRLDAQENGRTYALVTDLCLVGAVGAAAFGGYWYWYKFRPQHEKFQASVHAKVDVVPWVQPQAGGLFAAGTF